MRNIIFNIILMLMITNIGAVTMDKKKMNVSDCVTNITIEPKIENFNKIKKAYANINKHLIEE